MGSTTKRIKSKTHDGWTIVDYGYNVGVRHLSLAHQYSFLLIHFLVRLDILLVPVVILEEIRSKPGTKQSNCYVCLSVQLSCSMNLPNSQAPPLLSRFSLSFHCFVLLHCCTNYLDVFGVGCYSGNIVCRCRFVSSTS